MLYFPKDKCNNIRIGVEKGDIVTVKDTWTITAVEFPAVYVDELDKINIVIEKQNDVVKEEDDAIKVIRCKDCRYHKSDGGSLMVCSVTEMITDDNDFCSFGERREP